MVDYFFIGSYLTFEIGGCLKLEFSKPDDILEAHNEVIKELEPLTGEYIEGDFYKALTFLSHSFVEKLLDQEEEFDLPNYIANIAYVCMKIGYKMCEKHNMRVN